MWVWDELGAAITVGSCCESGLDHTSHTTRPFFPSFLPPRLLSLSLLLQPLAVYQFSVLLSTFLFSLSSLFPSLSPFSLFISLLFLPFSLNFFHFLPLLQAYSLSYSPPSHCILPSPSLSFLCPLLYPSLYHSFSLFIHRVLFPCSLCFLLYILSPSSPSRLYFSTLFVFLNLLNFPQYPLKLSLSSLSFRSAFPSFLVLYPSPLGQISFF